MAKTSQNRISLHNKDKSNVERMVKMADYDGFYIDPSKLIVPPEDLDAETLSVEQLVTLHAQLLNELPWFPRGTLAVRRRGQRVYYSVQTTVDHRRRDRYLSLKTDSGLIDLLRIKRTIRIALKKIRKASRHLKGYRRRLAAKLAVINRPYAESYIFYTNKIYVCSTAEAAIVEMLHKHHVRFEYAPPTMIGGRILYPDFKYIVDGQPVYHEHHGLLNKLDYAKNQRKKWARYRSEGFVIGKDLLISVAYGKRIDLMEIEQMLHTRGVF